jgi:hypothetical protein
VGWCGVLTVEQELVHEADEVVSVSDDDLRWV